MSINEAHQIENTLRRLAGMIVLAALVSCGQTAQIATQPTIIPAANPISTVSQTPFQPGAPYQSKTLSPSGTAEVSPINLWIAPMIPNRLKEQVVYPNGLVNTTEDDPYGLQLGPDYDPQAQRDYQDITWTYALVAPFPTLTDGVSLADLKSVWTQKQEGRPIILAEESTITAMQPLLGKPGSGCVESLSAEELLHTAWSLKNAWAIVPFENLEPRWKVLSVDEQSPLDKSFDAQIYPLNVHFYLAGPKKIQTQFDQITGGNSIAPSLNRDPHKLTVVLLTGVTALVRATANRMDTKGLLYPGEDIRAWMRDADITHVSNEASFDPTCPPGDPLSDSLRFCSRPEYLALLQDVGVNVVELSGNHLNDWSSKSLGYTLDVYRQHDIRYYAAGRDLEEARQPLVIENNGNRIAFIGCNPAGPELDWVTQTLPGSAPCDLDWESQEVGLLRSEGILPIFTFQYFETYQFQPLPGQVRDFRRMAEAGAAVVSGSQAHFPQTFEFDGDTLIHYGLGNLFFDQMAPVINGNRIEGTRREFLDKHVFYDGHYIGSEILTAMLEDYARPRPMTPDERISLLQDIFKASGW
jgi:hypothetical protein